jgi:GNAT superfamily N-acetyltransferase
MTITAATASGLRALDLATEVLHRARLADPEAGIWEAADLQWWWRVPRPSDDLEQLFWLDAKGPAAAALLTDWTRAWGLDVIAARDAPDALVEHAWAAATERIDALTLEVVETLIRDDDDRSRALARSMGFEPTDDHSGTTWMEAAERPPVPALPDGFTLVDRTQTHDRPHPLVVRSGPSAEARLNQVSLYDPGLDLAIVAATGEVASYALFWFDPMTRVGLVEPMRTEDAWQRRGLGRTLLATGLERLADRGATRLKVGFASAPGRALYLGSGFCIGSTETTWVRRTRGPRVGNRRLRRQPLDLTAA